MFVAPCGNVPISRSVKSASWIILKHPHAYHTSPTIDLMSQTLSGNFNCCHFGSVSPKVGSFVKLVFFSLVQTHKPKSVVCIAKEHLILSNPKNLSRRKDQLTRFLNTLKGRSGACYLSTSSFRNGAHRKGLMLYIVILDSKCLFFPLFQGRFVLNLSEKTTPQKASQRKLMRRPEMDFFRSFVGSQALCFDLKLSKGTYIPRQNQACKTSCSLSQELSFTNLKWHGQPFGAAPQAAKVSHVFFFGQTEGFVGSPKKKESRTNC